MILNGKQVEITSDN